MYLEATSAFSGPSVIYTVSVLIGPADTDTCTPASQAVPVAWLEEENQMYFPYFFLCYYLLVYPYLKPLDSSIRRSLTGNKEPRMELYVHSPFSST